MKTTLELVFIVTIYLLGLAICWPSGAPEKACGTLLPRHGSNVAKPGSSSPFYLSQSHQDYGPSDKIRVTLKSSPGISFKGLIIQAYDPSNNQPIGSFQPGKGLKIMTPCSAVTHSDKRGKRAATLLWEAPSTSSGKVAFRGTVVQRFSEFYEGIHADLEQSN